jgi:hypothetical protein
MQVVRAYHAPKRQFDHLTAEGCQRGSVRFFLHEWDPDFVSFAGDNSTKKLYWFSE